MKPETKSWDTDPQPAGEFTLDRQVRCARFNPQGTSLMAGGLDAKIHRWTVGDHHLEPLPAIDGFNGWIADLAYHPTHDRLFAADTWGQLRCLDADGQTIWKHEAAHDGWIRQLAVNDGSLASSGRDGFIRVWDRQGKMIAEKNAEADVYTLVFHPDGKRIVYGDLPGRIRVWNFEEDRDEPAFDASEFFLLHRLQDLCGLRQLRFLSDNKTLVVAGCIPGGGATPKGIPTLQFFDFEKREATQRLQQGGATDWIVEDLVIHPDGYLIAVTSGTPGKGQVFCMHPGEEKPFYTSTKISNPHAIALHPDGRMLAIAATSKGSNGNGRKLDKDGNYLGNHSPIHLLELPAS